MSAAVDGYPRGRGAAGLRCVLAGRPPRRGGLRRRRRPALGRLVGRRTLGGAAVGIRMPACGGA